MKHLSLSLLAFLFILISCSNTKPNDQKKEEQENTEVRAIINRFFKQYGEGKQDAAIDYIFGSNKSFSSEQITDLKSKLNTTLSAIGKFCGSEEITTKSTSPSLVYFSFLVKHEKQPLRFTFVFYRPKEKWLLYKFKFDDQVDTELEEAGRIYFIK